MARVLRSLVLLPVLSMWLRPLPGRSWLGGAWHHGARAGPKLTARFASGREDGDEHTSPAARSQAILDDWELQRLIKESVQARASIFDSIKRAVVAMGLSVLVFLTVPLLPSSEAAAAAGASQATELDTASRAYLNVTGFPFPLGPFFERKTVMTELVKDKVYSFEQPQDLAGITANVRCTAFRMRDGRLAVYNPLAPTGEFLQQLKSVSEKGVAHIMLGSTAYEHKVYTPAFSREFPEAKLWAVPDQWSWPVDLPPPLLGLNATGDLLDTASSQANYASAPDFTSEFEVKLLHPQQRLSFGYSAVEAAVFHKDTKVVALTDAMVNVPATPTAVYDKDGLRAVGDKRADSYSIGNLVLKAAGAVNWRGTAAQENASFWSKVQADGVGSEMEQVQRGWELNTLLSLYFGPSPSSLVDPHTSFEKIKTKWIVAPVTNAVIYSSDKVKPELKRWVNDVAEWDFNVIAPSHFAAGPGTPADLRTAFATTLKSNDMDPTFDTADFNLLDDIKGVLKRFQII